MHQKQSKPLSNNESISTSEPNRDDDNSNESFEQRTITAMNDESFQQ
jgi:hypothetical protein